MTVARVPTAENGMAGTSEMFVPKATVIAIVRNMTLTHNNERNALLSEIKADFLVSREFRQEALETKDCLLNRIEQLQKELVAKNEELEALKELKAAEALASQELVDILRDRLEEKDKKLNTYENALKAIKAAYINFKSSTAPVGPSARTRHTMAKNMRESDKNLKSICEKQFSLLNL